MKINPEQKQAIEHTGSPLVIHAGPGTGKTLVLQKKYEYLIKQGITPHLILALTFTRSAAAELSERIVKSTNIPRDLIIIRTFHSLCLHMLKKHYNKAELPLNFSIVDSNQQDQIITQCLQEKALPFTPDHIFNIRQIIGKIKKEQQSASADNYIEEYTRIIYPEYQQKLLEAQKIDYDDIIRKALALLNDPRILSEYQSLHRFIMLDEAQDTTTPQAKIIYKFECPNTTIVGDQNQAIYSFAGANPNFMREFEENTGASVIHLKHNYRNPQNIINNATTVIKYNENYIENELIAHKETDKPIGVLFTPNEKTEARLIANCIEQNNLQNVTILYRRNESSKELEFALQERGIPYQINGIHFYDRKEIKNIIAAIRLIFSPENPEYFRTVLKNIQGIGKQTIEKIIQHAEVTQNSLFESGKAKLTRFSKEQHLTLKQTCQTIQEIIELPKAQQLEKIIQYLIPKPKNESQTQNITAFKNLLLNSKFPLTKTLDYIKETQINPNVRLMTLHAAKGTENSVIFIIGTEEGLIPDENAFISPQAIEEERRLFYVGLTRTQETLILSHTQSRFISGFNLTQQASRFLNEIPEKEIL